MGAADSFNTNPIVIDLTDAADRPIRTGKVFIKKVLLSGNKVIGGGIDLSLTETVSGKIRYRYYRATNGRVQDQNDSPFEIDSPFFNNLEGNVFAARSLMLLYLE